MVARSRGKMEKGRRWLAEKYEPEAGGGNYGPEVFCLKELPPLTHPEGALLPMNSSSAVNSKVT